MKTKSEHKKMFNANSLMKRVTVEDYDYPILVIVYS